jgi:hypothetical protein
MRPRLQRCDGSVGMLTFQSANGNDVGSKACQHLAEIGEGFCAISARQLLSPFRNDIAATDDLHIRQLSISVGVNASLTTATDDSHSQPFRPLF